MSGTISRRDALRRLGALVGGALSAPVAAGVLGGCRVTDGEHAFTLLSQDEARLVGEIAEMIIPETDTPGARTARVDAFIDQMLDRWFSDEDRERFLGGLRALDQEAGGFVDASAEAKTQILQRLDAEAVAARLEGASPLPFFAQMKELTLVGYYTSEIGGSEELQYVMLPGRYDGDVPLEDVGRAYSRCSAHE